jgi:two-component system chemotaxis sensor kinase CheA
VFGELREQSRASDEQKPQAVIEHERLLLFRAGSFERLAVPLSLVARLEEFPRSEIEHASGGLVVQYRSRILPLVSLRSVLEPGAPGNDMLADPVQVVVFNDGDHSVGMVVDQILDVAEEAITVRQRSARKGLLGSAVVGKRVTDFLDLNEVIHATEGKWIQGTNANAAQKTILVVESSAFSRGLIRSGLDMAGYMVLEASNLEEAIHRLEQQPVDVVVSAVDLPPHGSAALLAAMRCPEWAKIPVLALVASIDEVQAAAARSAGFQDCQAKFDGVLVLESVARLASPMGAVKALPVYAGEVS